MKKSTLFVAMAAIAVSAAAQYQVDPGIQQVLDKNQKFTVDAIVLDETSISEFTKAGCTVRDFRVNDETRFLYVWDGTFNAGDSSYPGVDFQMDGYPSLEVASVGWSGAGFFVNAAANWNMSNYTEQTRLHLAYRSSNEPASVGFIFMDEDNFNKPAKISVGSEAFNDNGVIFPLVGNFDAGQDWAAIDISFGDLKKLWPAFDWSKTNAFQGNVLSFLAGGVTGKNISLDAIYIYTPTDGDGVEAIAADNAAPVYYNLQGVRVANPQAGNAYIMVKGSKASKVIM